MLFIRRLPTWAEYLAFSPDGSCLGPFCTVPGRRPPPPPLLRPRDQRVTSIAFSPPGAQLLAVCRGDAPLASADRFDFTLRRFDVARRVAVGPPVPIGMAVAFGEREA